MKHDQKKWVSAPLPQDKELREFSSAIQENLQELWEHSHDHEAIGADITVDEADRVVVSDSEGLIQASHITTAELDMLQGVTSLIQAQLNGKLDTAVTSIAKSGNTSLIGAVTLSAGTNVTLTQVGQDISIAGTVIPTAPAGSNTEVQYNNAGAFGASSDLTFASGELNVGSGVLVGASPAPLNTLGGAYGISTQSTGILLKLPTDSGYLGVDIVDTSDAFHAGIEYNGGVGGTFDIISDQEIRFENASVLIDPAGGNNVDASAALDVNSIVKGFLPPRMTTAERNAVVTPATGLQVYNTTTNQPEVYDGSNWVSMVTTDTDTVTTLSKSGSAELTGTVTLSEGANITLTQVGNDIEIAATSGGSGVVNSGTAGRLAYYATSAAEVSEVGAADVSMASKKITNLANGSSAQDAAAFGQIPVITAGQIVGTATNDAASAGNVGEYVTAFVSNASIPASYAYGDMTSISLTAGDWMVTAMGYYNNANANTDFIDFGVGNASGTSSSGLQAGNTMMLFNLGALGSNHYISLSVVPLRVSLSAPATRYLKVAGNYSSGTPVCTGRISAWRIR